MARPQPQPSSSQLGEPYVLVPASSVPKLGLKCPKCPVQRQTLAQLETHISDEHFNWFPYQCGICRKNKATKVEMEEHYSAVHLNLTVLMVFTPNPAIEAQIATLLEEAKASAVDVAGVIPVDYKPNAVEQPARSQAKQQSATAVSNAEERINPVALAKGIRFVDKNASSPQTSSSRFSQQIGVANGSGRGKGTGIRMPRNYIPPEYRTIGRAVTDSNQAGNPNSSRSSQSPMFNRGMKSSGNDQVKEEPLSDDEEGKRMEEQDAGEDGPCSSFHTSVRQMPFDHPLYKEEDTDGEDNGMDEEEKKAEEFRLAGVQPVRMLNGKLRPPSKYNQISTLVQVEKQEATCRKCGKRCVNRNVIINHGFHHLATEHKIYRYHCLFAHCTFKNQQFRAIQAHLQQDHKDNNVEKIGEIFDNKVREKLKEVLMECFEEVKEQDVNRFNNVIAVAMEENKKKIKKLKKLKNVNSCGMCNVEYEYKNRYLHVQTHLYRDFGILRYECQLCNFKYGYGSLMQKHTIKAHGVANQYAYDDVIHKYADTVVKVAKECFGRKYNIMSYVLMKGKNTGNKVGPRPKKRKMDEEDNESNATSGDGKETEDEEEEQMSEDEEAKDAEEIDQEQETKRRGRKQKDPNKEKETELKRNERRRTRTSRMGLERSKEEEDWQMDEEEID
ncbi:hypothetical protein WR25_13021 [Diploscapter pachys]|uniref:C2H2-type domain-containing protein n=1 Tax=Diploscapter pachys TaxID=2018661 RepID=A0A2A2JUD8_9BILA|nr:hypothetical protein WR25_13021 [Diploscapter pachys]